jgi:hypothetical protein
MKKFYSFLLALALLTLSFANAAEWHVTTLEELNNAWTNYVSGDTIFIAAGTYETIGNLSVTKSVTLMAESDALSMPVLTGVQFIYGQPCSFEFNGLEVYCDAVGAETTTGKYFLQAVDANLLNGTIPQIIIKNANIHGFGRGLLRADNSTNMATITQLQIENCLIWDMGRNSVGYSTLGVKTAKISNAVIINSTFYNSPNGTWNSEDTTTPINFLMENCCIIKTTSSSSKLIITNKTKAGSTYTVKNSIISHSYDDTSDKMQLKFADTADEPNVVCNLENSILGINFKDPKIIGTLANNTEVTVSSLAYDYDNMTITTDPNTVKNIGDPRWKVNEESTGLTKNSFENIYAYFDGNNLRVKNLPLNSTVDVFDVAGKKLFSLSKINAEINVPVKANILIIKVFSNEGSRIIKVLK